MFRGAAYHSLRPDDGHGWAVIIAVLFAIVAAVSFAVDVTIGVSGSASKPASARLGPPPQLGPTIR